MEKQDVLLKNYTDMEKGAYIAAIASIATADHSATEEELDYIMALADSAELSDEQKEVVSRSATDLSADELTQSLDILKNSELKYSLLADLIAFAEADQNYSEQEKASINKMANYLGINQQQYAAVNEFVKTTQQSEVDPAKMQEPNFLSSMGLGGIGDKLKNSGINVSSLLKGLVAVAGPMILSRMMSRGRSGGSGGGLGGMLGGMLGGGGGGMLGGGGGGGLGSLIGMLSGGRGFGRSGGLLGRIL